MEFWKITFWTQFKDENLLSTPIDYESVKKFICHFVGFVIIVMSEHI